MEPEAPTGYDSFLHELLSNLARNARGIALFCILALVASSIYALTRETRFTSSAVLMVPGGTQQVGIELGQVASQLLPGTARSLDLTGLPDLGSPSGPDITVAQRLLSSRTTMEKVILRYDLVSRYDSYSMERALEKAGRRFSVDLSDDGFLIVSAQADERERAAAMVRDWISIANDELSRIVTSRARRARMETEEALRVANDSLQAAQQQMEEFRTRTGLYFLESQSAQAVTVLGEVEASLVEAEAELAGLRGAVSHLSPAYREIARKVEYLRGALEQRLGEGDSLSVFPGLQRMPAIVREFETLETKLQARRLVSMMLQQQLEKLRIREATDSPTLEVVVPPSPSHLRSYPKRKKMVFLFTLAALVVALALMTVLTYLRRVGRDERLGPFWKGLLAEASRQLYLPRRLWRGLRRGRED
ncbi:hypothetical protein GF402_00210 [Candidatus Fermentibacteria bacterium]|nr:hypothetical protein [Candidatus Fermentibacteria bacterium]